MSCCGNKKRICDITYPLSFDIVCTIILLLSEPFGHVLLDTCSNILGVFLYEGLASDMLIKLDIALADACNNLVSHLGHLLALLTLEAIIHEPLAYELL